MVAKKKATRPRRRKAAPEATSTVEIGARFPRYSVGKALRIAQAILEQNAGKASTPKEAAGFLGRSSAVGTFNVEIAAAAQYGFIERPTRGLLQPSALAKQVLRPQSSTDAIEGYRQAVRNAPVISAVYQHYRGENLPDDQFLFNALTQKFGVSQSDVGEFKRIFLECLQTAELTEQHGDKLRVVDVDGAIAPAAASNTGLRRATSAAAKAGEVCFVMQPFAPPLGDYYEKIYRPAIEKAGLQPLRADNEIFGTGKIMDQVWSGISSAKVLVAELTGRNPNVFYELGLAHALRKPVVLVSSSEDDVPFDLQHIRVIYYDVTDPFWGTKLIDKVAENIASALSNPEEAVFRSEGAA